jgi:hypothetical protein
VRAASGTYVTRAFPRKLDSLHFRYRVIVHSGEAKSIDIPALFVKFAVEK